jgi:hypothetical protein
MPSAIYWSGLGRLGIRRFSGTAEQLLRSFDGLRELSRQAVRTDDGELVDATVEVWDRRLPAAPDAFLDRPQRLELERHEADYLRNRVRDSAPGSLLDVLLDIGLPPKGVPFPWQHPRRARFPSDVRRTLEDARHYSEAMLGGQLLYNLLLMRAKGIPEWTASIEKRLAAWKSLITTPSGDLDGWDRATFWSTVGAVRHVSVPATAFVNAWCDLVIADGVDVESNKRAVALITDRERSLKGPLARIGNQPAIDRIAGPSGDGQYEFRWLSARRTIEDILDGLKRETGSA